MEPGLWVTVHQVSNFGWVGSRVSVSDSVFDPVVLSFNMRVYRGVVETWRCFYRVTPSQQTNIRSFGSVPVTALLVYLFQLVPVIFTYLRADCPCDVTTFLDLTSFRLLTGSGNRSKILTRFRLWTALSMQTSCLDEAFFSS